MSGSGPGSAERQAEALRAEGVEVEVDGMGEFYVDMGRFGWFPEVLPSEEGLDLEGDKETGRSDSGRNGNGIGLFC